MSQLFIRPMYNDHLVIADLLAQPPGTLRALRPPVAQVVVDAQVAVRRPHFAEAAAEAGVPLVVDPLTPLLQTEVDAGDGWHRLPYASADPIRPADIDIAELVELSVQTQLEAGASAVVAPYLYATSPDDPAFKVSLNLLTETRRYLDEQRLGFPLIAVLCAQLRGFGSITMLESGVSEFCRRANDSGAGTVSLLLSPLGNRDDSYSKLSTMVRIATNARQRTEHVVVWRQGVYGPILCALGLDGYETGMGLGEQTNVRRLQTSRRPLPEKKGRPVVNGLYFEALGRSVTLKTAQHLLGSIQMRALIVCDEPACCRDVGTMIKDRRQHAVRSRARTLALINQQPHQAWRLHHIARQASDAATTAKQADKVLAAEGVRERVGTRNLEALARVARELADRSTGHETA